MKSDPSLLLSPRSPENHPEKKFSKTKPASHDMCVEEISEYVKHIQNITETQLEKVHEILRNYKIKL
jgi:hypothetical protein